jgi:hypothetical protein
MPDSDALVIELAGSLMTGGLLLALVFLRDVARYRAAAAARWVYAVATGKTYVLVWIDDATQSARLVAALRANLGRRGHVVHQLPTPSHLFYYPANPAHVAAIVLIDTDVSKISDEPRRADQVASRLASFVERGGGLVGCHDIIYRRVRRVDLQNLFGYAVDAFRLCRDKPVAYRLVARGHPLAAGLDERFHLHDGEVGWRERPPDATVVFRVDGHDERPLVIAREHCAGRLVWLNSGDKADELCRSLAAPEPQLVQLMTNAVQWVSRR